MKPLQPIAFNSPTINETVPPMPWLNVIVLHWEDHEALARCLNNLEQSDYARLRILVVENGSAAAHRDAVIEMVSARLGDGHLHLLLLPANLGYAGGNNKGLEYLEQHRLGGHVCILNPDVRLESDTLSTMMRAITSGVGLVMCRAVTEEGKVLYDCIRLEGYRQTMKRSDTEIAQTDYAQGACLLVNREVVRGALFDERFFLYWEEVDLSIRVRDAGLKVVSITNTQIRRGENSISRLPNALYYSARNAWLLRSKYRTRFSRFGYGAYFAHLLLITAKLIPTPRLLIQAWVALLAAIFDARQGRYGRRGSGETAVAPSPLRPTLLTAVIEEERASKIGA